MTTTLERHVLADLAGMPDGPPPDKAAINDWVAATFDDYFLAAARHSARTFATQATECEQTGRWTPRWDTSRHAAVLRLLAAAEQAAPEEDRPWHAARLDAYADRYGLSGWHRCTDLRGKHCIQINLIRTREDGDTGRHYVHAADRGLHGPTHCWVVDRDTGRTAYRTISRGVAAQWIQQREHASETPTPTGARR